MTAYLAYALKNGYCVLEISDMEYGDDKFDIGVMTDAVNRVEPAGLAECVLFRRTLREYTTHKRNGDRQK